MPVSESVGISLSCENGDRGILLYCFFIHQRFSFTDYTFQNAATFGLRSIKLSFLRLKMRILLLLVQQYQSIRA